jgi:hypothetical protein
VCFVNARNHKSIASATFAQLLSCSPSSLRR